MSHGGLDVKRQKTEKRFALAGAFLHPVRLTPAKDVPMQSGHVDAQMEIECSVSLHWR
jgi:hypothetical protein